MRQLLLSSLVMLSLMPAAASWQVGLDLRCIDSAFMGAVRIDGEASWRSEDLRLTMPLRISISLTHELGFAETGLIVSVYPFEDQGFFIGASMARVGLFWGLEAPSEPLMLFSEIIAGWTFSFPWLFIEPRLSILDAFASEEGRIGELKEAVPQYSKIRISLIAGIEIP